MLSRVTHPWHLRFLVLSSPCAMCSATMRSSMPRVFIRLIAVMLLCSRSTIFAPVIAKPSPNLFSFFTKKTHLLSLFKNSPIRCNHNYFFAKPIKDSNFFGAHDLFVNKKAKFCTLAISGTSRRNEKVVGGNVMSLKEKKKARREAPEGVLKFKLDTCSKCRDVVEGLRLYDEKRENGVEIRTTAAEAKSK